MNIRNTIFGVSLLSAALAASALSLGSSRGSLFIGAPIDLVFDVEPDPGSDLVSACLAATIKAGDGMLSESRIRVTPLAAAPGRAAGVRVQAPVIIDEPVVTVTLSAGCASKVIRTYTFLPELPSFWGSTSAPVDVARIATPAVTDRTARGNAVTGGGGASSAPSTSVSSAAPAAVSPDGSAPAPSGRVSSSMAPSPAPKPVPKPAPKPVAQPAAKPASSAAAPTAGPRGSRLVVEPLESWLDAPTSLRGAPQLEEIPSEEGSARRAEAAAAWKALRMTPDEAILAGQRLAALENEQAQFKARWERERTELSLQMQRLQAQSDGLYGPTVVYTLAGLLLGALGLAGWAFWRMRRTGSSAEQAWRESVALSAQDPVAPSWQPHVPSADPEWDAPETLPTHDAPRAPAVQPPAAVEVTELHDHLLAELQEDARATTAKAAADQASMASAALAAVPSALGATTSPGVSQASPQPDHIVNVEDLFDILQQAEFFVSVGEHGQAIDVLRQHIADHQRTSPYAYLELLRLLHTLSRADDFAQLRTQFMRYFNASVPEFSAFHRAGRSLEYYPGALALIEEQWASEAVLGTLEGYLFREDASTEGDASEPFDLAAFDDLLLLLAIVQTTPASARGKPGERQRTTPLGAPADAPGAMTPPAPELAGLSVTPSVTPLMASAVASLDDAAYVAPAPVTPQALDFDFGDLELAVSLPEVTEVSAPSPAPVLAPVPPVDHVAPAAVPQASVDKGLDLDLDLDLDLHLPDLPPPLTISDLPSLAPSSPPEPGAPIGFGSHSDRFEARFELDPGHPVDKKP